MQNNLNDGAIRYNKDIIVVETAYPFAADENNDLQNIIRFQTTRGYPATPEGQMKTIAHHEYHPSPACHEFIQPAIAHV